VFSCKSSLGDSFAFCNLCRRDVNITHDGRNDLKKKHCGTILDLHVRVMVRVMLSRVGVRIRVRIRDRVNVVMCKSRLAPTLRDSNFSLILNFNVPFASLLIYIVVFSLMQVKIVHIVCLYVFDCSDNG